MAMRIVPEFLTSLHVRMNSTRRFEVTTSKGALQTKLKVHIARNGEVLDVWTQTERYRLLMSAFGR